MKNIYIIFIIKNKIKNLFIKLGNLLRCSDLNILYTDSKSEFYDYDNYYNPKKRKSIKNKKQEKIINSDLSMGESDNSDSDKNIYSTPVKSKTKILNIDESRLKENLSSSSQKDLLHKYCSLICYLLIKKISIKLYLSNNATIEKEEDNGLNMYYPFVELLLKETQTIFTKKLDLSNETRIIIADMELLEILESEKEKNENKRYKILSEFTQNLITGERDDYENMVSNDYKIDNNAKKRRELRRSSIKEERVFKIINEENENELNDNNDDINLQNSLNESRKEMINKISKRNTIMVKSNLFNNSLKEEIENNLNNLNTN